MLSVLFFSFARHGILSSLRWPLNSCVHETIVRWGDILRWKTTTFVDIRNPSTHYLNRSYPVFYLIVVNITQGGGDFNSAYCGLFCIAHLTENKLTHIPGGLQNERRANCTVSLDGALLKDTLTLLITLVRPFSNFRPHFWTAETNQEPTQEEQAGCRQAVH